MEGQSRIVACGQMDVGITLVVAQQDVVARAQTLDQLRFEQQGLGLGTRQGDFDLRYLGNHRGNARLHARLEEIAANALLQIAGLADVEQIAGRTEHAIDARRAAQIGDKGLAVEWKISLHGIDCRVERMNREPLAREAPYFRERALQARCCFAKSPERLKASRLKPLPRKSFAKTSHPWERL